MTIPYEWVAALAVTATIGPGWLAFGLLGQAVFTARFAIQWIVSERRRESVIPRSFWYCSVGGAVVLLTYAIHRRDPVFIIGQSFGLVVYVRNLMLLGAGRRRQPLSQP